MNDSPLGMYEASVPLFLGGFRTLSGLLTNANEFVASGRIAEHDLIEARLAPDMDPLRSQIQRASDTAKGCAMRLAGRDVPSIPDDETTLQDLQDRVAKTQALLLSLSPGDFADSHARSIKINMRRRWVTFDGRDYLLEFALPNFFFHVTAAYAILRHNGLKIGKLDYLADVRERWDSQRSSGA
ncbi:DUF1993 domain-containing protein [Devosia sp. 1566]|uniref:DUF1993 domain-containing protein n=1 Tax=Devosia sp. 1566 TaxID=2499144 RepID=UPI0019D08378|nr:DUF1993 domain-containing protein [Devosia sp. 1566]